MVDVTGFLCQESGHSANCETGGGPIRIRLSIDTIRAEVEGCVTAYPETSGDRVIWRTPLAALAGLDAQTHVCGKCQVLVPCSLKVPSAGAA